MPDSLHNFSNTSIGKNCEQLTGDHTNELFAECTFDDLRDLTLKNCDLYRSQFLTDDLRKALGFTVTMNCNSFRSVKLSPLLFDLVLCLLIMGEGNDDKRKQLIGVIGKPRYEALSRVLNRIE